MLTQTIIEKFLVTNLSYLWSSLILYLDEPPDKSDVVIEDFTILRDREGISKTEVRWKHSKGKFLSLVVFSGEIVVTKTYYFLTLYMCLIIDFIPYIMYNTNYRYFLLGVFLEDFTV